MTGRHRFENALIRLAALLPHPYFDPYENALIVAWDTPVNAGLSLGYFGA